MKYRVECAAQRLAELIEQGVEWPDAQYRAAREYNLSDNERCDMRDMYDAMQGG